MNEKFIAKYLKAVL